MSDARCADPGARADYLAAERAIVLRVMTKDDGDPSSDRVEALPVTVIGVLLGLRSTATEQLSPEQQITVDHVVERLAYRCGAELHVKQQTDGATTVIDANPVAGASDTHDIDGTARSLLDTALRTTTPLRHARLHDQPPVVVLPTAGDPTLTEKTLRAHLTAFALYEHTDIAVLIVDDAGAHEAQEMAAVVERACSDFPYTVTLLNEWDAHGPGRKARLRDQLIGAGPDELITRCYGPSLPGSANLAFWLLQGRTIVWLEQDASPFVAHRVTALAPESPDWVESVDLVETWDDLSVDGGPSVITEPVDILFHVDWSLDAPARLVAARRADADWPTPDDPSYERVSGELDDDDRPVRVCTFHIGGHGDYAARVLHVLLAAGELSAQDADRLLNGALPYFRVMTSPPTPVVVGTSKTAFGTVIALSATQSISPTIMPATAIRVVDFAVGALLLTGTNAAVAWAGAALTHYRAPRTDSGRGRLGSYMHNEDRLWPLLAAINEATTIGRTGGLAAIAAACRAAASAYTLDQSTSQANFYDAVLALEDHARNPSPEPWQQSYAGELTAYTGVIAGDTVEAAAQRFHGDIERDIATELLRLADQLDLAERVAAIQPPSSAILSLVAAS